MTYLHITLLASTCYQIIIDLALERTWGKWAQNQFQD